MLVFGLHYFQMRRHSDFFLEQARESREKEDVAERFKAVDQYARYLSFAPDDVDAMEEFGVLLVDYASLGPQWASRAYTTLEQVLREDPTRSEARRKLVALSMVMRRFDDAQTHLEELRKASPADAEILELLAQCQVAQGKTAEAEATLLATIEKVPSHLNTYVQLARDVYRASDRREEADAIMNKMVEVNPDNAEAYCLRGQYSLAMNKPDEAGKDVAKALELAPEDPDVLMFAAQYETSRKDFDAARRYAQRVVDLEPKNARGYYQLNAVEQLAGNVDVALEWINKGLAATEGTGDETGLLVEKAMLLVNKGMSDEGEAILDKLRKLRLRESDQAVVGFLQARVDHARGEWSKALKGFDQVRPVLQRNPQRRQLVAWIHQLSADCQGRLGLPEQQKNSLARARELGMVVAARAPDDAVAKARAMARSGRGDEAIEAYRVALAAEDAPPEAWIEFIRLLLGKTLRVEDKQQRDWGPVDEALVQAAKAMPDDWRVVALEAAVRRAQERPADADAAFREAFEARVPQQERWTALIGGVTSAPDAAQALEIVDRAIQEWGKADKDLAQVKELLEGDEKGRAERVLSSAFSRKADCWVYVQLLAQSAIQAKDWDKLGSLLDDAEKRLGDAVALRLLRAHLWVERDGKKAAAALKKLQEGADAFPENQRELLQAGLADEARRAGDYAQSLALLEAIAERHSNNLKAQRQAFHMALLAHDEAAQARILARIKKIEGPGPWWHCLEALRLTSASDDSKKDNERALDHLAQAKILRPNWGLPAVCEGNIYYDMGNQTAAMKSYSEAIDKGVGRKPAASEADEALNPELDEALEHGARKVMALARYEQLLRQNGRLQEANQIIGLLEQQNVAITPARLFQRGVESLRERKTEEGLADIRQAADDLRKIVPESEDFHEFLQLAQYVAILAEFDRSRERTAEAEEGFKEAEHALRRAAELAPAEAAPWVSLVVLMNTRQKTDAVEMVLAEARQKVPQDQRPLVLAQCHEKIGRFPEAEQQYQEAIRAAKSDSSSVRRLIAYYLRAGVTQPTLRDKYFKEAERMLQKMVDASEGTSAEDVAWARSYLAELLLGRGRPANRTAALKLVNEQLAADPNSTTALRLKARILAYLGSRADREEAKRIFDRLLREPNARPDDRYALARLLLFDDDWTGAAQQMQVLLGLGHVNPEWLRFYIQAQIRHGELGGADANLRWLDRIDPGKYINLFFRAWILSERGDHDGALKVVKTHVDGADAQSADRPERLALGVTALEALDKRLSGPERADASKKYLAQAEVWLRELVQSQPKQEMQLVAFLARHGRHDEALELAETAWKQGQPIIVATTVVGLLSKGQPTPDQIARVEAIIDAAIEKKGEQVPLLLGMAELRTIQKRYDDAEKLYRRVLELEPNNFLALNNLAVFLALRNIKLDESLKRIDQAIDAAGLLATLYDTRATINVARGDWKQALEDIQIALAEEPSGVRYFHQARAYFLGNQKEAAAAALKKAKDLGLTVDELPALERPAYRQLETDLE